ncbi:hypothetical protein E2C01_072361 [Portunus trituberculatus]|nr:hypothetical protein [Portunus trituberculatus]
MRRMNL